MTVSTHHFCLDIRGYLRNHTKKRDYQKLFQHNDGRFMSADEAKDILYAELLKGHSVIPTGPCEGFSYQTGCPGHPAQDGSQ